MYLPNAKPDYTLWLPRPPSLNGLFNNAKPRPGYKGSKVGGRVLTPAYKKWKKLADEYAIATSKHRAFKGRVAVAYTLYVNDAVKRDCANYEKALSDWLNTRDYIVEDSYIQQNVQQFYHNAPSHLCGMVRIDIFCLQAVSKRATITEHNEKENTNGQ